MILTSLSVTNYRSITKAHKINLDKLTILVGKNNEGKSNLIKALNIGMQTIILHSEGRIRPTSYPRYARDDEDFYYWERDFPITLQNSNKETESEFRLEFCLNNDEIQEFRNEIKLSTNGRITVEVRAGKNNYPKVRIKKRGTPSYNEKSDKIAEFISQRISINHIPAVRTDRDAVERIREILTEELVVLEKENEYQKAIETINMLQQSVLDKIAQKIKTSLESFIPTINEVKISISKDFQRIALRRSTIVSVDDGVLTPIEYKGDGIKSLAALAMLNDRFNTKSTPVIAIEEPESHLHPAAMHQLANVIQNLAETNQVILTTHNPLFVNRESPKANIIVDNNNASPAKDIRQIREVLGVKTSDNLYNADFVLVVEGEDDVILCKKILSSLSCKIKRAIEDNLLIIEEVGGAGNLSYKLTLLRDSLCKYYVFLDNDEAGKKAGNAAINAGLVSLRNLSYTICNGMLESEIEDCLSIDSYAKGIESDFNIMAKGSKFRSNKKWSIRMRSVFLSQGKQWNDNIEKSLKINIANKIENSDKDINDLLCSNKRSSIDGLVSAIERFMG